MGIENQASIQSKGGKAAAKNMSALERKSRASKAANARWGLPEAIYEGEIKLGETEIPCAVVIIGDETKRIISNSGFMKAIGRPWKGSYERTGRPNFLEANNLQPLIDNGLEDVLEMIEYRTKSGAVKKGYLAEMIPKVCEVYLEARSQKVLHASQVNIAKSCEIIMRGLAHVGILSLVDEATGYQEERAKDALAKILEEFISKELQSWTRTFPLDFYKEIFRLKNWEFDPNSVKRPSVIGHYTNNFIYKRLAPGVLDELKSKEPKIDGRRKNKLFQWLNGDIGHPKLLAHIESVKSIMKISPNWNEFKRNIDMVYPITETTELGLTIEKRSNRDF